MGPTPTRTFAPSTSTARGDDAVDPGRRARVCGAVRRSAGRRWLHRSRTRGFDGVRALVGAPVDQRAATGDGRATGDHELLDVGAGERELPLRRGGHLRAGRGVGGPDLPRRLDLGRLRRWAGDRTGGRHGDDRRNRERDRSCAGGPQKKAATADVSAGRFLSSQLRHCPDSQWAVREI